MQQLTEEQLFKNLIEQFYQSALIYLGKTVNPQTKKTEKNLFNANYFAGMLKMMLNKTKGNLSFDEKQVLENYIKHIDELFGEENN